MLRRAGYLVALPILCVAWFSLTGVEPRAEFVVSSDELRTIDPHRVSYLDEIQVAAALFEGLTRLNPDRMTPEPAAAESWEFDASATTIDFFLRPELRWSDGSQLTAEDFRWSWLRVLTPATQAQYASLLFVVDGAERFFRSRLNDDPTDDAADDRVGVVAESPTHLRVRLTRPCPYFLDLTSFPTLSPVNRAAVERARVNGQRAWTQPSQLVTNGAFELQRWDFKRRLLLVRSNSYWDRDAIDVDSIEVYITGSPTAALVAYETGRIDLLRGVEPDAARKLRDEQRAGRRSDFHLSPRFATFFLRVNCTRPPLKDNPTLRQALSLAIDRRQLCENVLGLGEAPTETYVPRGAIPLMSAKNAAGQIVEYSPPKGLSEQAPATQSGGANDAPAGPIDLDASAKVDMTSQYERARALLAQSGYLEIARDRPLGLAFASDPPQQRRIVEALQAMWESVLGIRVELAVMERKVLSEKIRGLDYDLVRSDWFGDYMDPGTFLDMFTTGSGQNRTGFSNAAYDGLIAAAAGEPDPERRFSLFQQAERILCVDELPIIPLFERSGNYLLRERFTGLKDNVRDYLPIHRVRRER